MKTPWKKKWLRRAFQTVLLLGTLYVLAAVVMNWWGARERNRMARELQAAGIPVNLAALLPPLPPDEQNFAKLPLFTLAAGDRKLHPQATTAEIAEAGKTIGDLIWPMVKQVREYPGKAELASWAEYLDSAPDPKACLAAYDARNAVALAALREGLERPYVQSARLREIVENKDWASLGWANDQNPVNKWKMVQGMVLRGYLALGAGEPEIALESLRIGYRVADLTGSGGVLTSYFLKESFRKQLLGVLREGLARGVWDEADLRTLEGLFAERDYGREMREALLVEEAHWILLMDYWKQESGEMLYELEGGNGERADLAQSIQGALIPRGWFDLSIAWRMREHARNVRLLSEADSPEEWYALGTQPGDERMQRWWMWERSQLVARNALLRAGATAMTKDRLARTAIALERYRLAHQRYPATLEEMGRPLLHDPFGNGAFLYGVKGAGYELYSAGPERGRAAELRKNEKRRTWRW